MTRMEEEPKIFEDQEDEQKLSIGTRIDRLFTELEKHFYSHDKQSFQNSLSNVKTLMATGGDWDRKNRLSVYEGLSLILFNRDYANAATLIVPAINTYELNSFMPYKRFLLIAVVTGYLILDRTSVKKNILDNPEVIMSTVDVPELLEMGNALFMSNYAVFMENLKKVVVLMLNDDILNQSVDWWCREMRIKAYTQMMRSYLSVKLDVFAMEFGMNVEFIEKELETFIAQGRLHCQIDKVNGIVMNSHKDKRNELYVTLVKEGDVVVEKVQRLLHKLE